MEKTRPTRYFLGANSRYGFRSLYGGFCPGEEGCFLHVIKGGPGCGKSSFMRRIGAAAEEKGLAVEYVLCSGDPDSLDGVFIPALSLGYVDGTAPHVIEAGFPGCVGSYLDLGRFYDASALRPNTNRIMDINRRYKALYALAYEQIAAGAALLPRRRGGIWGEAEREKIAKKVAGFARREFSGHSGRGKAREIFSGAVSCKGIIAPACLLEEQYERLCLLDNELGLGHLYLELLLPKAVEAGIDVLVGRDALEPELIASLAFPSLSLALCCGSLRDTDAELYRHIRLDALPDRERMNSLRPSLRRSAHLGRDCLAMAVDTLAEAKALHDELEGVYNGFVDFDGVYSEAERHIAALI